MGDDKMKKETFEEFKNSFSYGKRTDLNFKFLARLEPEEAAEFFQDLLWHLGDSFIDGNLKKTIKRIYEWQIRGYAKPGKWTYEDGPFSPLNKPVSKSRITLLSSSGHFVAADDPQPLGIKNMTQEEAINRIDDFIKAEPILSVIPSDISDNDLRVRHGGYDIRAAQADPNVVFPLGLLRRMNDEMKICDLADKAYSFIGACSQMKLMKNTAPEWARRLMDDKIEAALLVPV